MHEKLIILFLEIYERFFPALKNLGNIIIEDALHFHQSFLMRDHSWMAKIRVLYHTFRDDNETAWMIFIIILCIIIIYLYIRAKKKPKL